MRGAVLRGGFAGEKMSFEELVQRLLAIPYDEERKNHPGSFEYVLSTRHLNHLYPILEEYFGKPFKPAGKPPTREAEEYARSYGGIQKNQTLYFFKRDGMENRGMIWPWNDGTRVTVKVIQGPSPEGK